MYLVTEYGAIGDGKTINTQAFQKAVDAAFAAGGGRVVVPPGEFLTGTINLKSHVILELLPASQIVGSTHLGDYEHIGWGWGHDKNNCDVTPWHLIQARNADGVGLIGEGQVRGNGPVFWEKHRPSPWHFWRHLDNQRPSPMVHFEQCRNVRVEGVTLTESPGWTLHCHDCEGVAIRGITIRNTFFGPNTDGMDISNCRRVRISDCDVETGDDAIALMASGYGGPSEDITISNCVLKTSCVGVRFIGFDAQARHRMISVGNIVVPRCSRIFDFIAYPGASIRQVNICGCVASTNCGWPYNRPIEIGNNLRRNPHEKPLPPSDNPSEISYISISHLTIETDGRIMLLPSRDSHCHHITLSDISIKYVMIDDPGQGPASAQDGRGWLAEHPKARVAMAAIVAANISHLLIQNVDISWPTFPIPRSWLLLESDQRLAISGSVYAGKEEQIRSGQIQPRFTPFWADNLLEPRIDIRET